MSRNDFPRLGQTDGHASDFDERMKSENNDVDAKANALLFAGEQDWNNVVALVMVDSLSTKEN